MKNMNKNRFLLFIAAICMFFNALAIYRPFESQTARFQNAKSISKIDSKKNQENAPIQENEESNQEFDNHEVEDENLISLLYTYKFYESGCIHFENYQGTNFYHKSIDQVCVNAISLIFQFRNIRI